MGTGATITGGLFTGEATLASPLADLSMPWPNYDGAASGVYNVYNYAFPASELFSRFFPVARAGPTTPPRGEAPRPRRRGVKRWPAEKASRRKHWRRVPAGRPPRQRATR